MAAIECCLLIFNTWLKTWLKLRVQHDFVRPAPTDDQRTAMRISVKLNLSAVLS